MKYRHVPYDFSLEVMPYSSGTLASMLKFQYTDMGNLFDHMAPLLGETPKVFPSRNHFTLVNVYCSHTGFSYGQCDAPPEKCLPLSAVYFFTFAITPNRYETTDDPSYVSLRQINMRAWGFRGTEFLTIGITHPEAQEFGLKYDMFTPQYVYAIIGSLTKSFINQHKYYRHNPDDYEFAYANLRPFMVRASMYMRPLYNLMSRSPYHMWVFNRHVWRSAPYLLSERHITPSSLLYYFMYVNDCAPLHPKIETKIFDLLQDSLLAIVQSTRDQRPIATVDELLYVALIYRDQIDESDPIGWLKEKELTLVEYGLSQMTDYRKHIEDLFYQR